MFPSLHNGSKLKKKEQVNYIIDVILSQTITDRRNFNKSDALRVLAKIYSQEMGLTTTSL